MFSSLWRPSFFPTYADSGGLFPCPLVPARPSDQLRASGRAKGSFSSHVRGPSFEWCCSVWTARLNERPCWRSPLVVVLVPWLLLSRPSVCLTLPPSAQVTDYFYQSLTISRGFIFKHPERLGKGSSVSHTRITPRGFCVSCCHPTAVWMLSRPSMGAHPWWNSLGASTCGGSRGLLMKDIVHSVRSRQRREMMSSGINLHLAASVCCS